MAIDVLRVGRERLRVGAWRGNDRVAYIAPVADGPPPTAAAVRRCCDLLAARGYTRVVTAAVGGPEARGFVTAGFDVHERLHLLAHSLIGVPALAAPPHTHLRRGRRSDQQCVLAVDGRAFAPFWRLDQTGFTEAMAATRSVRYRVMEVDDRVVGYAISGRSGQRGFIQRLAVDPDAQRNGIGTTLVVDALRWLRRWRAESAMVNTQDGNDAALALYERLGFRRQPEGLTVFAMELR